MKRETAKKEKVLLLLSHHLAFPYVVFLANALRIGLRCGFVFAKIALLRIGKVEGWLANAVIATITTIIIIYSRIPAISFAPGRCSHERSNYICKLCRGESAMVQASGVCDWPVRGILLGFCYDVFAVLWYATSLDPPNPSQSH